VSAHQIHYFTMTVTRDAAMIGISQLSAVYR